MNYIKELDKEELTTIYGGDKFMRDLGHICADVVQAIENAYCALADNIASLQGAPPTTIWQ